MNNTISGLSRSFKLNKLSQHYTKIHVVCLFDVFTVDAITVDERQMEILPVVYLPDH